jgi:integrase
MSLFKRDGSPNWYCEFVVKGNRIVRSTGTPARREAERFEKDLKAQVRQKLREERGQLKPQLTLDQACARYWLEHGSRLRGAYDTQRWLRYVVKYLDGNLPLSELSAKHVTRFVQRMRDDGIGEISINRTISTLQGVHNRAGKLWEEPVSVIGWKPFKTKERARMRWISQEQAQFLLEHLPDTTRHLVMFMLLTGIRKREAFELEWSRVHFDRECITIIAKGGIVRDVPLSPDALTLLHEIPRNGPDVFDTTNWRRRFDAAKDAANIDDFRWHDLRHTFATWLGQSGSSLSVIKDLLGHSSIAVTQKYRHVASSEMRDALQRVPSIRPNTGNVVPLKKKLSG